MLRKAAVPFAADEAASIYRKLIEPLSRIRSSRELLDTALDLHRGHSFSWWDSLDLQHGREIRGDCAIPLSPLTAKSGWRR